MLYCNPEFVVFFLILFPIYFVSTPSYKNLTLMIGSLVFLAWSGFGDLLVLLFVTTFAWLSMGLMSRYPQHKKVILKATIVILLFNLCFFKYVPWLWTQIRIFLPDGFHVWNLNLRLPFGISFFTLQGISFLVDFSNGREERPLFKKYLLYKSLFPHLIAGPIVRGRELLPQLHRLETPKIDDIVKGSLLFAVGFFKKVAIADRVGAYVDRCFDNPNIYSTGTLMLGAIALSIQIWGDFSGYTDMGRGVARMLGIRLPENFLSPYFSKSISEFWRRWHITLSEWIRDYLYMPLALKGMRKSYGHFLGAIFFSMLMMGIWHGASWNMVFYGMYLGLILVAEQYWTSRKIVQKSLKNLNPLVRRISGTITCFVGISTGYIIFRSSNLDILWAYLNGITSHFGENYETLPVGFSLGGAVLFTFLYHAVTYFDLDSRKFIFKEALEKMELQLMGMGEVGQKMMGGIAGIGVAVGILFGSHFTAFYRKQIVCLFSILINGEKDGH